MDHRGSMCWPCLEWSLSLILALSVGNTNVRYAIMERDRVLSRGSFRADVEPLGPELEASGALEGAGRYEVVVAASVRPDLLGRIEDRLRCTGTTVQVAGRDFAVPIENLYCRPEEVGVDRLLVVLAASRLFPGEATVVVDLGTALTVNVGSPRGEFAGGLIGLGATTAARALPRYAPRLPRLVLEKPSRFLGRTTRQAINDGIVWEVAGGVERMLRGLRETCEWPLRVLATGGDAELVAPLVEGIERVDPDLLLRGTVLAWRLSTEGR